MGLAKILSINDLLSERSDGKIENFEEFYDIHHRIVRSVLFRFSAYCDLEDGVQEVFLRAWSRMESFENRSNIKTWLLRIAVNFAIDETRKRRPIEFRPEINQAQDVPEAEEQIANAQIVRCALSELKGSLKAVLILNVIEGYSLIEVAEIMEIPIGTVKSRLNKARKVMKSKLDKMGLRYGNE